MVEQKSQKMREPAKFIYDYKEDILLFRITGRNYSKSVELQNLVADIDEEGFVTGIRIFDASKVFGVDKNSLKNLPYRKE